MGLNPVIIVLTVSALETARAVQASLDGASIHGLARRVDEADETFEDAVAHIRACFAAGHPVIGICAAGILIRALAPELADKQSEPPVLAVAEDRSAVVPLLGGHHGANDLARRLAGELGGTAAITTAGDVRLGVSLDAPPPGWALANPGDAKAVMASILNGASIAIDGHLPWLDRPSMKTAADASLHLMETVQKTEGGPDRLIYYPRSLIIGVGCERGCPREEIVALVDETLSAHGYARQAVACVVSLDLKADEPAVHEAARRLDVPARFLTAEAINAVADRIETPSDIVMREVAVPGVAEGAALAAGGEGGTLAVAKQKSARATCAIVEAPGPVEASAIGRARGRLSVVGIGPGTVDWRSPEATRLLNEATDWVGYGLYLDLAADLSGDKAMHRFELGAEEQRVRHALTLASQGRDVALVCSGDAGIYAMAALVFELVALPPGPDAISDAAHRVEIVVAPGISAVQAAAARAGAPIGHDFCCISLSDLLTPWETIERRVRAAANGDFVVAFYNPRSMRRRDQIVRAMAILRDARTAETPVMVASRLGRPDEEVRILALGDFNADDVDMLSIVLVGARSSRTIETGDGRHWVFTPRGYDAKRGAA